jgi:hypothetical protein
VAGQQRHTGLGHRGRAQDAFERAAPALHAGEPACLVTARRHLGPLRPGGQQRLPHLGNLGVQRIQDLLADRVRVVELHDATPLPRAVRRRTTIPVHDRHTVSAAGKGDGAEQPGGAGANDGNVHDAERRGATRPNPG